MDQAFKELYFHDECYENLRDVIESKPYTQVASKMEEYVGIFLKKVQQRLYQYHYDDQDQAEHYVEQINSFWAKIQHIAKELGKYQQISKDYKIVEYHKNIFCERIFQDQVIGNALKEIFQTYEFNSQIKTHFNNLLQYFKPKIRTHQDLMTNWLTYGICEQINDEIKDFEKRLECATTFLPENEKQKPKLPPNWEKNISNQLKKKKKKL